MYSGERSNTVHGLKLAAPFAGDFETLTPMANELRSDEVHLWIVPVPLDPFSMDGLLTSAELERAGRFVDDGARGRFVTGRAVVREGLSRYLAIPASLVSISTECKFCGHPTHGKPHLITADERGTEFSLSHAGQWVMFAASRGIAIGVDIERIPGDEAELDVSIVCTPDEARAVNPLPADEKRRALAALWTAKEAYMKGRGVGLASSPSEFSAVQPGWAILEVPAPEGYVAAVAVAETGALAPSEAMPRN